MNKVVLNSSVEVVYEKELGLDARRPDVIRYRGRDSLFYRTRNENGGRAYFYLGGVILVNDEEG